MEITLDEGFLGVILLDGVSSKHGSKSSGEFPTLNVLRSKRLKIENKQEEENLEDNVLKVCILRRASKKNHAE